MSLFFRQLFPREETEKDVLRVSSREEMRSRRVKAEFIKRKNHKLWSFDQWEWRKGVRTVGDQDMQLDNQSEARAGVSWPQAGEFHPFCSSKKSVCSGLPRRSEQVEFS